MKRLYLLSIPLVLAGCRASTDRLSLKGGMELRIGQRRQIQPPGAKAYAASRDGSLMAVILKSKIPGNERLEVRRSSGEVVKAFDIPNTYEPLMFSLDNSKIYDVGRNGWIDLNTRQVVDGQGKGLDIVESRRPFLCTNLDRTIMMDGRSIFTASGRAFHDVGRTLFDSYGFAWYRSRGIWTRVAADGKVKQGLPRPRSLVADQSHDRGSYHLVSQDQVFKRRGGTAYVSVVWLDRVGPAPRHRPPSRSGVVYAGKDVLVYGFVPGRNEIFVVTYDDTELIPYSVVPERTPDEK